MPRINPYSNISDFFTLSKHTPTARRRCVEKVIQYFASNSQLVQDSGLIASWVPAWLTPHCVNASTPLDLLGFLYVRITADENYIIHTLTGNKFPSALHPQV